MKYNIYEQYSDLDKIIYHLTNYIYKGGGNCVVQGDTIKKILEILY